MKHSPPMAAQTAVHLAPSVQQSTPELNTPSFNEKHVPKLEKSPKSAAEIAYEAQQQHPAT